jgi:hypothetical protein
MSRPGPLAMLAKRWARDRVPPAPPGDPPMIATVTAVLVGGRADGRTCAVPAGAENAIVTTVDGEPKSLPPYADPDRLMERAKGTWEMYEPIKGLAPDRQGRIGYWVSRALPSAPDEQAGLITDDLVEAIEQELLLVGNHSSWEVLRRHLAVAGYTLALD